MIIKVYFEKTEKVIPFNNQHQMNGFIFRMLGENAGKYHDSFSRYSVSSIQGGRMSEDKTGMVFEDEPYIQISSEDTDILKDFVIGIINTIDNKSADFFGLHPVRFDTFEFPCNKEYDVIRTISPILLKKDGRKLNIKDEGWLENLNRNCIDKLRHEGIEDNGFRIEIGRKETVRTKMIMVGDIFNPCTEGIFTVYGTKESRKRLYSLGLGNSTGTGFGSVKIMRGIARF